MYKITLRCQFIFFLTALATVFIGIRHGRNILNFETKLYFARLT